MKGFTYQFGQRISTLETYEWDNIWWEHAERPECKRGLIIGDSISCGYRGLVNEALAGAVYMDGLGTSKGIDNPFFTKAIDYVISQQAKCRVITFNNGLHGLHLDIDEYRENYHRTIRYLKEHYPEKQLIIVLTTPVKDEKVTSLVEERNRVAEEIARKEDIPVADLFTPICGQTDLYKDGVHLRVEGYRLLAEILTGKLKQFFGL